MWKNGLLLAIVAAGLGFLLWQASQLNAGLEGTSIGGQGTAALVLGIVGTVIIGCGISGFFFWAARRQTREEDAEERSREAHLPRGPNRP